MTKFWRNQTVQLQSALGAAQTITAITKASNGQVTTSGTLPTNGQYVLLEVAGMKELNFCIVKVSGATGSNFTIGQDTTLFGTFTSGTFKVLTFGLAFTGLREPNASGGDAVKEDTTTIHDSSDTEAIVGTTAQGRSFTHDWEPTNAALVACANASAVNSPLAVREVDPDGSEYLYYATVSAPLAPTVSGLKKVTPISFSLKGRGIAY